MTDCQSYFGAPFLVDGWGAEYYHEPTPGAAIDAYYEALEEASDGASTASDTDEASDAIDSSSETAFEDTSHSMSRGDAAFERRLAQVEHDAILSAINAIGH